jgi:hypothetical protein
VGVGERLYATDEKRLLTESGGCGMMLVFAKNRSPQAPHKDGSDDPRSKAADREKGIYSGAKPGPCATCGSVSRLCFWGPYMSAKKNTEWASAYKDSRWQKKRLEIMERDKWTCQGCHGSLGCETLNVHHRHYEHGKNPWEYDDECLVTLCEDCHKTVTEERKEIMKCIGAVVCTDSLSEIKKIVQILVDYQDHLYFLSISDKRLECATIGFMQNLESLSAAHHEGFLSGSKNKGK